MTKEKKETPASKYSAEVYAKTKKYQKKYGFKIGTGEYDTWNNEADAFKHTFAAVDMALKYNDGLTKLTGDYHEWQGRTGKGQSQGEENMDKWNNAEGRKIAQKISKRASSLSQLKLNAWNGAYDDLIADEVMQKMRKGDLITHPSDARKYNHKRSKGEQFVHDVEEKYNDTRTAGQKFDDEIRAKYREMKNGRNQRIFGKSSSSGGGNGHWITMNGGHVFIEE